MSSGSPSGGQVHFSTADVSTPFVWSGGISAGTWYHVVGTFESGTKSLYIDGIERMTGTASVTSYDAEPFRIGCDRGTGEIQNFFVGDIDDVRLYGRALAASEVAALAAVPP
ncbi:MAG: LamG domain-containing protein [Kofleriaceae bacterium]|nr:LamG domain-containing protein [Kofleriaceae bacterium]